MQLKKEMSSISNKAKIVKKNIIARASLTNCNNVLNPDGFYKNLPRSISTSKSIRTVSPKNSDFRRAIRSPITSGRDLRINIVSNKSEPKQLSTNLKLRHQFFSSNKQIEETLPLVKTSSKREITPPYVKTNLYGKSL